MPRTQANRQAKLITPLGTDELLFFQMVAHEGISELFDYDLVVLSENENVVLGGLVGQHAHVELELRNDGTRYFCGHVTRFAFIGFQGNLAKYSVKLRPWLWFLSQTSNCRIFQKQSVPGIIKAVCRIHGFTDIDDRLTDTYEPREFCVQYRESDLDFISRLMEDEGIYYYFVHEAGKHVLVLADGISAHSTFGDYTDIRWFPPDRHDHRESDHIDHWELCQSVRSGKYATRDYHFRIPSNSLEARSGFPRGHMHDGYQVYDYPGGYGKLQDGSAGLHYAGQRYASKRLQALQADFEVMSGAGNARGLKPGHLFTLGGHDRDDQNREYLVLSVTHDISSDDYGSTSDANREFFDYGCSLRAMAGSEQFRPPRTTQRPIVFGPQTAKVVGDLPPGEIWTDEYGRVKVEFHWDRADHEDGKSSCFVRVSQIWAGKKWGAQFLPRIGHEVVVEFLEGDPDRPLITGAVYNEENKPPYELAANKTQSGIKTRSYGSSNAQHYNEIRFEDKAKHEKFIVHAQKDMKIEVENDRTEKVLNDEVVEVKGNRTHKVGKEENGAKTGDDKREVKGKDEQKIHGKQKIEVLGEKRELIVKNDLKEDIDGKWENKTKKDIKITSEEGKIEIKAPQKKIKLEAPEKIEIKADPASGQIKIEAWEVKLKMHNEWYWKDKKHDLIALYKLTYAFNKFEFLTGLGLAVSNTKLGATNIKIEAATMTLSAYGLKASKAAVDAKAAKLEAAVKDIKMLAGKLGVSKQALALYA